MREIEEYRSEIWSRAEMIRRDKRRRGKIGVTLAAVIVTAAVAVSLFVIPTLRTEAVTIDLTEGIEGAHSYPGPVTEEAADAAADFSVRLVRECLKGGENVVLSPVSAMCSLALLANGEGGDTLTQTESVLGMKLDDLNGFFSSFFRLKDSRLTSANSVWIKSGFRAKNAFLQSNADFYRSDAYSAPFDPSTVGDMNEWVSEKTEGQIPELVDTLDADTVLTVLNALSFNADWSRKFEPEDVEDGVFARSDGQTERAEFMVGQEDTYISDGGAVGFVKPFETGCGYEFAAILPEAGTSPGEYLSVLSGASLRETLKSGESVPVKVSIPKFSVEYGNELSDELVALGIKDAFDPGKADFSGIAGSLLGGNLSLGGSLQKAFVSVGESGVRASAGTVNNVTWQGIPKRGKYEVSLDRPFIFLIVEKETKIPLFIGVVNSME